MPNANHSESLLGTDPYWYKDAVIYQLHVKSFYDSNQDGIGDFKGLTAKLDYIQDLGISAIWLLPFYPSPLKDDGYDISDYKNIHPSYGTLNDFKKFIREAHRRGIRVITELVVNHTSDQHGWFQRARNAKPESNLRNWYVWSDTPERYQEARIIFQDFESSNWAWDPVAKAYYWHRFYSHQPDLNYDNPQVQKAIFNVLEFWLDHGVDGFRMDAVPYLFEREGTNCENLPESHEFLKKIRAFIDKNYKGRMLLAEANQWPEDVVEYFGNGDEFNMAFHFPLMPRLYMALHMEDAFPIPDIMEQTPVIPETCQWATFLRNHDELTLEMVTDEERDYMYRVYALDPRMRLNLGIRRRLFPLLGNHRRRIELMNALLFSMPGTPIIYYGDELGMGDNIHLGDRDGVRTPMQWSADRNAGFSQADPQELYLPVIISPEYHFEVVNVEVQQRNPHSMLNWMKRLIALRKRFKAFSSGSIEFIKPENYRILAFFRRYENETILVVVNLSRFVQFTELDLSAYQGSVPVELFGRNEFPRIGSKPYFLSIGPHSFYWFLLISSPPVEKATGKVSQELILPEIFTGNGWGSLFREPVKAKLEEILPDYFKKMRWFGGKARAIKRIFIRENFTITNPESPACILLAQVEYMSGDAETYVLPVTYSKDKQAESILNEQRWAAIATLVLEKDGKACLLHDALADKTFCLAILKLIFKGRRFKVVSGELLALSTKVLRSLKPPADISLEASVLGADQSNTSVIYGKHFILKLLRRLTPGVNPDLEIGKFLTEKKFPNTPLIAGSIEYNTGRAESMTLAILQGYIPNQGDAWMYTLDHLRHYFDNALAMKEKFNKIPIPSASWMEHLDIPLSDTYLELIGPYLESARLLGERTAQLHMCLASDSQKPEFKPEPFSKLYQRSLYQSMRTLASRTFYLLRRYSSNLPETLTEDIQAVLKLEKDVMDKFRLILGRKISTMRIRCHGDFHLGQVLYTGKDFLIIDFEGEPARPISERRIKRSPIRDVAGMIRSFHYAVYTAFFTQKEKGLVKTADKDFWELCINFWYRCVCLDYLKSYIKTAGEVNFLPRDREDLRILLDIFLLEKAIYEIAYEVNSRPDRVEIPLKGIIQLLSAAD